MWVCTAASARSSGLASAAALCREVVHARPSHGRNLGRPLARAFWVHALPQVSPAVAGHGDGQRPQCDNSFHHHIPSWKEGRSKP